MSPPCNNVMIIKQGISCSLSPLGHDICHYNSATVIACCGQFSTQVRQLMHSDIFAASAFPSAILKTDCGHMLAQVPSPSHLFLSIVTMYMRPYPPRIDSLLEP